MNNLRLSFFFLIMCPQLSALAQPSLRWQKCYGGSGMEDIGYHSLAIAADGGYLVAGCSESSDGDVPGNKGGRDFFIFKTDTNGNVAWTKNYGGSNLDRANALLSTPDGGCIVAGTSYSKDGDLTAKPANCGSWLLKLDAQGNLQWQKMYGGDKYETQFAMALSSDKGYFLAGGINPGPGFLNEDLWVVKIDSSGGLQWERTLGGSGIDIARCLVATSNGGCLAGGATNSTDGDFPGSHGFANAFDMALVNLDAKGNVIWKKTYGGPGEDGLMSLTPTKDGNFIICGYSGNAGGDVSSSYGIEDLFIMKLDTAGTKLWSKSYGGSWSDVAMDIVEDTDGGYIVAGETSSANHDVKGQHDTTARNPDAWLIKVDGTGSLVWQKCLGGMQSELARCIKIDTRGDVLLAGTASSYAGDGDITFTNGGTDIWLIKMQKSLVTGEQTHVPGNAAGLSLYPNPFSQDTRVYYNVPATAKVAALHIYDLPGSLVRTVFLDPQQQYVPLSSEGLMAGIYFCALEVNGIQVSLQKILVIR